MVATPRPRPCTGGALHDAGEVAGQLDPALFRAGPPLPPTPPLAPYGALRGYVALYPTNAECLVNGERVRPQDGGFYGGWVTNEIVGPWKGGPGSGGW